MGVIAWVRVRHTGMGRYIGVWMHVQVRGWMWGMGKGADEGTANVQLGKVARAGLCGVELLARHVTTIVGVRVSVMLRKLC